MASASDSLESNAEIFIFGEFDFGDKVIFSFLFVCINDGHDIITTWEVNIDLIVLWVLAFTIDVNVLILLHWPIFINFFFSFFIS